MKTCPICHTITDCDHDRKFAEFGLIKIKIIEKSIEAAIMIFSRLAPSLSLPNSLQYKIGLISRELYDCKDNIEDIRKCYRNVI